MPTERCRPLRALGLALLMLAACNAWGEKKSTGKPTNIELAQLPKFCYGRGWVPNADGPEFNMPPECGVGTNHYCSGLLHLVRAKSTTNKSTRRTELGLAENDIRYTEEWTAPYPSCSIREHIQASKAEVKRLIALYDGMAGVSKK